MRTRLVLCPRIAVLAPSPHKPLQSCLGWQDYTHQCVFESMSYHSYGSAPWRSRVGKRYAQCFSCRDRWNNYWNHFCYKRQALQPTRENRLELGASLGDQYRTVKEVANDDDSVHHHHQYHQHQLKSNSNRMVTEQKPWSCRMSSSVFRVWVWSFAKSKP